ncbi:hypothetical protein AB5I41_30900 [Sphingomonas sp. MMS24-JH45]
METRVVLSITSELTPLPNDFLELRDTSPRVAGHAAQEHVARWDAVGL